MKIISNKKIIILLVSFLFLFSNVAFAVWDGFLYDPGETNNPECLPSQTNCDVLPAVTTEVDPVFIASEAFNITGVDITKLSNLSGTNSGDNAVNSLYSGLATSKADVGQTFYIGTTQVAINRASSALTLAGITLTTPDIGVATGTSLDLGTTTLLGSRAITVDTGGVLNIATGSASGDDFTVNTDKFVVEGDTGNVGIGTAFPNSTLDVAKSTVGFDTQIQARNTHSGSGDVAAIGFAPSVTALATNWGYVGYVRGLTNGRIAIGAKSTYGATLADEKVSILDTGNIGIGTTSPTHKLTVSGSDADVLIGNAFSYDPSGNMDFAMGSTSQNSRFLLGQSLSVYGGMRWNYNATPANAYLGIGASSAFSAITLLQNDNVGIGTASPTGKLDIQGSAIHDLPTYSAEFLLDTGWTSTGWTGDFATGWIHTTGNTTALSQSKVAVNATKYQITYTITNRTAGSFTIGFGGQTAAGITASGAWGPTTSSTASLNITPTTDFDGTIVISIKSLTAASTPLINLKSSDGTSKIEMRANSSTSPTGNTFIGVGSGRYNTTGLYNTTNGGSALTFNTTGSSNTANGLNSLYSNTTGYNNTASGYDSLFYNITGFNNTASGMYSLFYNTTGYYNTANGYAALNFNTTGSNNTATGLSSLYSNTTGSNNTANGFSSLTSNTTGNYNTALGYQSGRYIADGTTGRTTGNNGLYLGYNSKASADATDNEIVVGYNAIGNGSNTIKLGNASITGTYFDGNLAKMLAMDRHTTANTAGNGLTLKAGGATLLATDKNGGDLTLSSGIATGTGTSAIHLFTGTASGTGTGDNATTEKMTILGDGNVGIGTATPTTNKLVVVGDIRVGTSGTNGCIEQFAGTALVGSCSSDINLKTNISPINGILDNFLKLQPVTYQWRVDEFPERHFGNELVKGLVAQEVELIFPELVDIDIRGFKTVDYGIALQMLSIEAIKELDLKIMDINDFEKENTWRDSLVAWFANAENRITRIFTGEVCLTEPGEETVCLNRAELKSLKALLSEPTVNQAPVADPAPSVPAVVPAPAPEATPAPAIIQTPTSNSAPGVVPTPTTQINSPTETQVAPTSPDTATKADAIINQSAVQ